MERRRLMLLVLAAAVPPAVEAAVLRGFGFTAAQGLAPQASAIWPYGAYHDMRWVFVYHNSWPGFVVELLLAVLLRGLLCAGYVALAWPVEADRPRPTWRWLVTRNVVFAAVTAVALSPWAVLAMAAGAVSLSWLLFASLLPTLLLALVLQRGGIAERWWSGVPSVPTLFWSLLGFVVLTVGGTLTWLVPSVWVVPVAAAAGAANGVIWRGLVRGVVLRRPHWPRVPVAPIIVLVALVAPIALRVTVGSREETKPTPIPLIARPLAADTGHSIIVIAGYGSTFRGGPAQSSDNLVWFSYRGLDAQGNPLPYPPSATYQSLETSAKLLAAQVAEVRRRTGRPVVVVAQSQGALIVRLLLARTPNPGVEVVALFSPPTRAGLVYYPPPGDHSGWGVAAGWQLRGLFGLLGLAGGEPGAPDQPLVRSILDNAPLFRNTVLCPVPGIRMLAFVPTDTAVVAPPPPIPGRIPVVRVPALHGGVIGRPTTNRQLVSFLTDELGTSDQPGGRLRISTLAIQRASGPWQAPPLAQRLNPVWRDQDPRGDIAFNQFRCGQQE